MFEHVFINRFIMKTIFHPAEQRGFASRGWLKSYHSFSFSQFYDPEKMNFGLLKCAWIKKAKRDLIFAKSCSLSK